MLGFLKHRILGDDGSNKYRKGLDYNQINPINEIQVLEGHTDIVRFLLKVDELR